MKRAFIVVMVAFAMLAGNLPAGAGTQPIVTSDLLRIRSVDSIDVAKDGSRAVYAVRSIATLPSEDWFDPNADPVYRYQSHIYVLELGDVNAVPRQVTFGDRQDKAPRLSPDGKRVLFLRKGQTPTGAPPMGRRHKEDDATTTPQVWMLAVDGGESRQVTSFQHGCGDAVWSPDGRRVLVSSEIPLDEMEGTPAWSMDRPKRTWKDSKLSEGVKPRPDGTREQIRAWLEHNGRHNNPTVIDRLEFQDEQSLKDDMRFSQLFIFDAMTISEPVTAAQARRITNSFADHESPEFMPDGQSVVYQAKKSTDQHLDRILHTSLWRVGIDGTNDRVILAIDGWSLSSPKPSRDGAVVAFLGEQIDEPAFRQTEIGIASIKADAASDPVWLTDEATFPASVQSIQWMQSQPALVFNTAMRGGFPLMTVSPGLVQPATLVGEVDGRPVGVHAFSAGGGAIVYSQTSAANPCVLKVRDARGDRQVMDLNPWVAEKNIVMPTAAEITRPDGVRVQYWLMEPTNREMGRKYPLVLDMHGGPSAMWGPGEASMWHEFQLLCSWGYGVVYSNPRGSGGYGYAFQKGNFQDWGEGPAGDVLAACDQAALKDWVDTDRLVITGGSYAGYLTAWIISHDNRFKAAVAQRGVYDLSTFFGEGNAWRLVQWAMGGWPYDPRVKQIIERNSPFTYVTRIKTPLLIKHASQDLRTGVSQSEMLYRALKEMGRPVEYVRYPEAGHDLSRTGDPLQRMDRLNRMIEFFERYVENTRAAPVTSGN